MTIFPNEWTTFQGRQVTFDTVDHQHLSNVYWYSLICLETPIQHLKGIMDKIEERFNGQLLPYRPHSKFRQEIVTLLGIKDCMRMSADKTCIEIWYKDVRVGEYWDPVTQLLPLP